MRLPDRDEISEFGAANYAFTGGYSMSIYDPEAHLRMLGQEFDLRTEARYEVAITHIGTNLCYLNPAGSGRARLDSLTWENVVNIFQILEQAPPNPGCQHSDEPAHLRMVRRCTRCDGFGEFTDDRGRVRSCNCIEGRV